MTFTKKILDDGIVSVSPLPTAEELSRFYAEKYYQESDGVKNTYDSSYTEDELSYKRLEAGMTLQAMTENIDRDKADIHILDLGCGEGFIVKTAFNEGYKVTGIDFSSFGIDKWNPEIAHLCQFGDIYKLLDEAVVSGQRYDVCILRNVLEHVIDPAGLLVKIRKILNVGGIAIISVPNDYSALQDLALSKGMIDREFWFAPPDHLYYFNTENIVPFMQKNDYAVMDMFSSFPVDFFLFHEGSNYIKNRSAGKAAHNARITIDLLLAQQGMEKFLNLYRAMAACGVGRDFTVVVKPA